MPRQSQVTYYIMCINLSLYFPFVKGIFTFNVTLRSQKVVHSHAIHNIPFLLHSNITSRFFFPLEAFTVIFILPFFKAVT